MKLLENAELTTSQKEEWERVVRRFDEVCKLCHENDKKVMVDAEETWMQDAADHLCEEMMEKYNQKTYCLEYHPDVQNRKTGIYGSASSESKKKVILSGIRSFVVLIWKKKEPELQKKDMQIRFSQPKKLLTKITMQELIS
jgi:hypothetical protein